MATSGWNRPSANKPITPRKNNSVAKGLVAGLIVVILASIAAYFIFSSSPERKPAKEAEKKSGLIGEATPAAAPKYHEKEKVVVEKVEKPYWERDTTNGLTFVQQMKWHDVRRPPAVITNNTSQTEEKPAYAIFDFQSENEIAALMTMEPGETLVGEPSYDRWFVRDFLKSFESPIIVKEDDPEDVKALKRDLVSVKADLKAKYDAGEDIVEVLKQTREDFQELARYKVELKESLREMSKTAVTEEDIDDCIKAANKMLDKKGIAPMELGPLARRSLLHRIQSF